MCPIDKIEPDEAELLFCYRKFSGGLKQSFLGTFQWLARQGDDQGVNSVSASADNSLSHNVEPEAGSNSPSS
jgi:hypothetical protein